MYNNLKNIADGYSVRTQVPLDDRTIKLNLIDLADLTGNKEYTYYEGMPVFLLSNLQSYNWVESTSGVIPGGFTYPSNIVNGGIVYSNRTFNFVPTIPIGGTGITGGGINNYLPKFTSASTIGSSQIFDNGVNIGINTSVPDASAAVDVSSTTQGFLPPRMTTIQRDAIASPVNGLLIFNVDTLVYNFWDNTSWASIVNNSYAIASNLIPKGTGSSIVDGTWKFSVNDIMPTVNGSNIGNSAYRIGTVFMSSTFDYANNLTWFNGAANMILTSSGSLGIGVTSPSYKLHTKGDVSLSGTDTSCFFNVGVDENVYIRAGRTDKDVYIQDSHKGRTGIGTSSPVAKVHIKGNDSKSLINQRLEPVTNVTEDTSGNKVTTTSASADVTIQIIAIDLDTVVSIETTIVYMKVGGTGAGVIGDGTTIKLNTSAKNTGNILKLDTIQNTYTGTINAITGVSATLKISGANILVAVTGVASSNIQWSSISKVITVFK